MLLLLLFLLFRVQSSVERVEEGFSGRLARLDATAALMSLDLDWELTAVLSGSASTLRDDDLDSLPTSASPSDLDDEGWDGFEDDGEFLSSSPFSKRTEEVISGPSTDVLERTPLQASRALDDEEEGMKLSGMQGSQDSSTNSAFSFHFPDPLDTSLQCDAYPGLYEPQYESEVADTEGEVDYIAGTDAPLSEEDEKGPATLVPRSPSFATSTGSSSPEATRTVFPVLASRPWAILSRYRLSSAAAIFALCFAVGLWSLIPWDRHAVNDLSLPIPKEISTSMNSALVIVPPAPTVLSTAVCPDETAQPVVIGLLDGRDHFPTISTHKQRLMLEAPPHTGFFIGSFNSEPVRQTSSSLSLNSVSKLVSSLSTTFHSLSNVLLRDLRDVLAFIDELLLFIRGHVPVETIQQHSYSLLDYLTQQMAHRHDHAKRNARFFTKKTMELAKVASAELAVRQETAVENAKHMWSEMRKWAN